MGYCRRNRPTTADRVHVVPARRAVRAETDESGVGSSIELERVGFEQCSGPGGFEFFTARVDVYAHHFVARPAVRAAHPSSYDAPRFRRMLALLVDLSLFVAMALAPFG